MGDFVPPASPVDAVVILKTIFSADGQRRLTIYKRVGDMSYGACEDMSVRDFFGHRCWTPAWSSELERVHFSKADLAERVARAWVIWAAEEGA
jgi:hypothetical protein